MGLLKKSQLTSGCKSAVVATLPEVDKRWWNFPSWPTNGYLTGMFVNDFIGGNRFESIKARARAEKNDNEAQEENGTDDMQKQLTWMENNRPRARLQFAHALKSKSSDNHFD